jgi:hypothetical protein
MSVARLIYGFVGASVVALAIGCGGADPTGQRNAAAQAGPNDMPTNDPPESDDPSNQEGSGDPCRPVPVAAIDGWTKHTNGAYSFQTPSAWPVTSEFTGNTDASFSPYYAETNVTRKIAIGVGYAVHVREVLDGGTPEAGLAAMESFAVSASTPNTQCTLSDPMIGTYACNPMASSTMTCGTATVYQRFVYKDGHRFEVWCNGSKMPDTAAVCAQVLDSVEVH